MVKKHLRVDEDFIDDDDDIRNIYIPAAREYCEDFTHRAIGTQTYELILDNFPIEKDFIELPLSPLQSVNKFTFKDSQGLVHDVDPDIYFIDTDFKPGKVGLNYNRYWPMYIPFPYAAIKINFTAGHTIDNIPQRIIQAMLLLIGHLYKHREEVTEDRHIERIPMGVDALLWPLKVW